jgi:hypothetical protein
MVGLGSREPARVLRGGAPGAVVATVPAAASYVVPEVPGVQPLHRPLSKVRVMTLLRWLLVQRRGERLMSKG